ncbi:MAG: YdeI/OmpD-associated family protein [Bacteroidota bacterium]
MIEIKSTLSDFNSKLWRHHFVVPEDVTAQLTDGENKRVFVKINHQLEIRSSLMPINKTESFVLINKDVKSKLRLSTGDEATLTLRKDTSTYGMEMPEELGVLLDQEPECNELFHQLTPGKQRSLIYLVNKVKNTNSRLNKALAIVHHLKEVSGNLDFKMLNKTIKYYNSIGKLS